MNSTPPVFKETVTKVHGKKFASKGYVFLVATAEIGGRTYTAALEVKQTINAEQRKIAFASMWNDLKPKVQGNLFKKPKAVKESNTNFKKVIAYAILGLIVVLILLSILL